MEASDPTELVRRGYDCVSHLYRGDDESPAQYVAWLDALLRRLPARAEVLDLGCGNGVPVALTLATAGHRVTGVDFSEVQISRARRLVPRATFLLSDATKVSFEERTFDAVLCLYSLIHIPIGEQPHLISRIATWLRPGGLFMATTGAEAWTGTEERWLGGSAAMWWSHSDAATYRDWISRAGLEIESDEYVPEGNPDNDVGHQLFWARQPYAERTPR